MRWRCGGVFLFLLAFPCLRAGEAIKSGPQAGELISGTFSPLNINGKFAGRYHCLVCQHDLNPVVMVFAREPEGKDQALSELLKKLDEAGLLKKLDQAMDNHQAAFLGCFVVFLSPAAKSSANNDKEENTGKLIDEATAREALLERLKSRADNLKNVVLAAFPNQGPKGYKINEKAEVTVIFYNRYKVLANFAFGAGQFQGTDVEAIVKAIDDTLKKGKK